MSSVAAKQAKKRRSEDKTEWARERSKRLLIAGKEYINTKGKLVSERQPGPDCQCFRKCYEKVNEQTRMRLFQAYYALKSHDEQSAYLYGLIQKVPIKQKRAEGSTRRTCSFKYFVRVNGLETQVCLRALENIHGIGRRKIRYLCDKLGQNVLFPRDERGRHVRIPKFSDDLIESVKTHIFSIIRSDRARDFLRDDKSSNGPEVNITWMYKDYMSIHDPTYAEKLAEYEQIHGPSTDPDDPEPQGAFQNSNQTWDYSYQRTGDQQQPQQQLPPSSQEPSADSTAAASASTPQQPASTTNPPTPARKRKKKLKDGRPEPLIRFWFYRRKFLEVYTTKEANALRKKALQWKCSGEFVNPKEGRKPRTSKTRTSPQRPAKKKAQQGAAGQSSAAEMYNVYPKLLHDLSRLEAHAVPMPHFQGQPPYALERAYRPMV